jgi:hypothetical protein
MALHQQLPLLGPDFEVAETVNLMHASASRVPASGSKTGDGSRWMERLGWPWKVFGAHLKAQ